MNSPEKIKIGESLRSIRDLGCIALDAVRLVAADVLERIDTKLADAINGDEDADA